MDYYGESNERTRHEMPKGLVLIGSVFAVALAVVIGNRLSNDSMAVLIGALCGISASVPACIGLIIALKQNWGRAAVERDEESRYHYPYAQPPVVVISPPQNHANAPAPYFLPPQMNDGAYPAREFKIIGEE